MWINISMILLMSSIKKPGEGWALPWLRHLKDRATYLLMGVLYNLYGAGGSPKSRFRSTFSKKEIP